MDPTPDEAAQLQTIGDVFTWAGLVSSRWKLGLHCQGHLLLYLASSRARSRVSWECPLAVTSRMCCSPGEFGLVIMIVRQLLQSGGMARLVGRACRTVAGATELEALKAQLAQAQAAAPQTLPPAVAGSLSSTATRRINMSAIISHVDESEVFTMEEKKVIKCYARYEAVSRPGR